MLGGVCILGYAYREGLRSIVCLVPLRSTSGLYTI